MTALRAPSALQSPSTNSDYCKPCLLEGRINRYDAQQDHSRLIHRVVHGHWSKAAEAFTSDERLYKLVAAQITIDHIAAAARFQGRVDRVLRWLHR